MELVEELVVAGADLDAAWRPGKCVVVVFGKLDGVAVEVVGGSLVGPLDGSIALLIFMACGGAAPSM